MWRGWGDMYVAGVGGGLTSLLMSMARSLFCGERRLLTGGHAMSEILSTGPPDGPNSFTLHTARRHHHRGTGVQGGYPEHSTASSTHGYRGTGGRGVTLKTAWRHHHTGTGAQGEGGYPEHSTASSPHGYRGTGGVTLHTARLV